MDKLNEYLLVEIFDHLDLQSRIEASKTCKLWRQLLLDPKATKGVNVWGIYIESSSPESDVSKSASNSDQARTGYRFTDNLDSLLTHIGQCARMEIDPAAVDHISATCRESIGTYLNRLGGSTTVGMEWEGTMAEDVWWNPLDSLPFASIERIIARNAPSSLFQFLTIDERLLSRVQLKYLDMEIHMSLPSSLTSLAFSWKPERIQEDAKEVFIEVREVAKYFMDNIKSCDALEDIKLCSMELSGIRFDQLIDIVRKKLLNLNRVRFCDVAFRLDDDTDSDSDGGKEIEPTKPPSQARSMTMDRLEFDSCTGDWIGALRKLLELFQTRTVSIVLATESELEDVQEIYDLIPTIDKSGTSLELTLNSIDRPRDLNELLIPSELRHVLVKLELDSLHHSNYLKTILSVPYDRLMEIRLWDCIEMDDADLRAVAQWCPNLRKAYAQASRFLSRRDHSPMPQSVSRILVPKAIATAINYVPAFGTCVRVVESFVHLGETRKRPIG